MFSNSVLLSNARKVKKKGILWSCYGMLLQKYQILYFLVLSPEWNVRNYRKMELNTVNSSCCHCTLFVVVDILLPILSLEFVTEAVVNCCDLWIVSHTPVPLTSLRLSCCVLSVQLFCLQTLAHRLCKWWGRSDRLWGLCQQFTCPSQSSKFSFQA